MKHQKIYRPPVLNIACSGGGCASILFDLVMCLGEVAGDTAFVAVLFCNLVSFVVVGDLLVCCVHSDFLFALH